MLWLIEAGDQPQQVYRYLEGAFAIRRIASLESFRLLTSLPESMVLPDLFLINHRHYSLKSVQRLMKRLPTSASERCILWSPEGLACETLDTTVGLLVCCPSVLVEQIFAVVKRLNDEITQANYWVDFQNHLLIAPSLGHEVELSQIEAKIMNILIAATDKTISRETLKVRVWQRPAVANRTVDSHISRLRKKLNNTHLELEAVYGEGYRLRDERFLGRN